MDKFDCYDVLNMEPDEARTMEGWDYDEAASDFAEWWDRHCGEGPTDEMDVMVRRSGTTEPWRKYTVWMELYPHYYAHRADTPTGSGEEGIPCATPDEGEGNECKK